MIVCVCNAITEHEVRDLARAGAPSPEAAYEALGCELQCGSCHCYAQEIIEEELKPRQHLRLVSSKAA